MKRIIIIVCSMFLFFYVQTKAQIGKQFSTAPSEFINELSEYMKVGITKENEEKVDAYIRVWREDSIFFTPEKRSRIAEISNMFLNEKARPFPHFMDYMQCQLIFRNSSLRDEEDYHNWEDGLVFMLEHEKININDVARYLVATQNLHTNRLLYNTASLKWRVDNDNFQFEADQDVKIKFKEVNLTCFANRDSIRIFNTEGYMLPVQNLWVGKGGLVTWERAGLSRDEVYAKLKNYTITLNKAEYEADSVVFTNSDYLDQPVLGILRDEVMKLKGPSSAIYPQFESYQKNFFLEDIIENIDYEGGLTMQGHSLLGSGSEENLAQLKMYNGDTLFMVIKSKLFAFKPDRISGLNTQMVLYISEDSIYHPDLLFNYYVDKKEVSLARTEDYTSQSPFYDSYHNLDMNFEQITWNTDHAKLFFKPLYGSAIGNANFQSVQLFDMKTYERLQYYDEIHPAVAVRNYVNVISSDEFTGEEFANYRKKPLYQIKQQLMELAFNGYIFYNTTTDIVKIRQKLHDQIYASVKRIDYDVLNIKSTTDASLENASFDLNTYDLSINGTSRLQVSNAQNVYIYPEGGQITMKRNRSFQFDGSIDAGLFTFYGKNFFFHYDSFSINLQNVDSVSIRVQVGIDNYGQAVLGNVKSLIEHVTGELKIDAPNNKSGSKNFAEYPIFDSREVSYVYYDDPSVQNGVYKKGDFYFELEPYVIDSLDNFNKMAMKFDGKLVSAGIFPDITESIVSLQEDLSLGFQHTLPPSGLPMYKGKGTFYNEIKLSNKGLFGNGKLNYITSTAYSDKFVFLPDSVNANANKFIIKRQVSGVQYPNVNSTDNYIHWEPYNDVYFAYKKDVPFTMFNDTTTLTGDIKLEPKGLTGWGNMDIKSAELTSDLFNYKADAFMADTADFNLKSLHASIFTVMTENVKAKVDFKNKSGEFTANEEYTLVEFPENQYISFLDHFKWGMEKKELEMTTMKKMAAITDTLEPQGPKYISIHPDQDSLSFISPLAVYNYEKNLIMARKVKYINVADARIFPYEGNVVVEEGAKMQTLKNSTVIANNYTEYHTIHSSRIDVFSRNNYQGVGFYDYIDENDRIQEIFFSKVFVDPDIRTAASGDILVESNFTLSPDYSYQGKVLLFADKPYLTFKGAAKIKQECDTNSQNWFRFQTEINPDYIYLPIPEQPTSINNRDLFIGLQMCYDSIHIYPSIFGTKKFHSDKSIVTAEGLMYFDKGSKKYKISNKNKLFNEALYGNFLSLDREKCVMYGEGDIDLLLDFGQIEVSSVGNVNHDMETDSNIFELLLGLDFYLSEEAIYVLATEIDSAPDLLPFDMTDANYREGILQLVGTSKAQSMFDDLTLYGEYKEIPEELKVTILFSKVNMVWDQTTRSYKSVGKIGIGSIGNIQINKWVNGHIEFQKRRSDCVFDMYIRIDNNIWYYFGYTRGVLQTLSSNNEYMGYIRALKPRHRKLKVPRNETPYIYMLAPANRVGQFLSRVQR